MSKFWENDNGKTQRYIETITPAIARELIDNLDVRLAADGLLRRPVNRARVKMYAEMIRRGEWEPMLSQIHLTGKGAALNGQHRLLGVIDADKSITCDVVKNTPPEWYDRFDTGHRTHEDNITISGAADPRIKKSLIPLVYASFNGTIRSYKVDEVPPTVVKEISRDYEKELDTAIAFAKGSDFKPIFVAFMYFHLNRVGYLKKCLPFLQQFKDGTNLSKSDPAYKLRRQIQVLSRNIRNKELLAKLFHICNRIVNDEPIGNLIADWKYTIEKKQPKTTKKHKAFAAHA